MFLKNVLNQSKIVFTRKVYKFAIIRFCSTSAFHRKDQFSELQKKIEANTNGFSPEFVSIVKKDVLSLGDRINSENFDSLFLEVCIQKKFFELGKQFFHNIHSKNGSPSLALLRKYFRLCYHWNDECSENDKEFLLLQFDKILKDYPLLDEITCENLSMGLSITRRWKEGIKLLDMCKEVGKPTSLLYASIIRAAFDNGDYSLGWTLLDEMLQKGLKPHDIAYFSIINKLDHSLILKMFQYFEKYDVYLPNSVSTFLKDCKLGEITTFTHKGVCQNCRKQSKPISINEDEFNSLKEDFLNPVLIGKDIFIKSKPSELVEFQNFLKNSPKVDIVLDGLNIAFAAKKKNISRFNHSKMLMNVVSFFISKNLRVMVLARQHMKSWNKQHMNFILNNACVFFAEDLSSDDSYLLYATMYNGIGTKFVSRDLMRSHKFLLKTWEKKKLFSMWQQKHQLILTYVENNGIAHLKDLGRYVMAPQNIGGTWHIPIDEPNVPGMTPYIQALNMKWMCINLNNTL